MIYTPTLKDIMQEEEEQTRMQKSFLSNTLKGWPSIEIISNYYYIKWLYFLRILASIWSFRMDKNGECKLLDCNVFLLVFL